MPLTLFTDDQTPPSVRPATSADLSAIIDIHVRYLRAHADDLSVVELADLGADDIKPLWLAELADTVDNRLTLVAVVDHTIVGVGTFHRDAPYDASWTTKSLHSWEVAAIFVDPLHQRQGHGSRLLTAGADILRQQNIDMLLAWIETTDTPRTTFLQQAGFASDGAQRQLIDPTTGIAADPPVIHHRYVSTLTS